MKEYLLIFRSAIAAQTQPTEEERAASMESWKQWIGSIAGQGKFTSGQPLTQDGRVMKNNNSITDAPFAEGKEVINGYLMIKAADYSEACKLSQNCPIFKDDNGTVEVREIMQMEM